MKLNTAAPASTLLRAQIDKANADHVALSASLPGLEQRRTDALVVDDMPSVEATEREIANAQMQIGRLAERVTLLNARLADAVAAEAKDAAERLSAKAKAVCDAAVRMLETDYVRLAQELARVLAKLTAAEAFIADANRRVGERASQVDGTNLRLRYAPSKEHLEVAKAWRFSNGWQGETVKSIGGSKAPPRPERRSLGTRDNDGNWQFEEPTLLEWEVSICDRPAQFLDNIEECVVLPALKIGESDFWNEDQRNAASNDFERLAELLLSADAGGPLKRVRNALSAAVN